MLNFQPFKRPRLRVCMLSFGLHAGGAERWLVTLAQQFQSFRVTSIVSIGQGNKGNGPLENELPRDIEIIECEDTIEGITPAIAKALTLGVDIIVGWGPMKVWPIPDLDVPVVLVSHGTWDFEVHDKPTAHFLASVSEGANRFWPPEYRDQSTVIYNGVALDRLDAHVDPQTQHENWGITDPAAKVLLYHGRFSPEKNPEAVLSALPLLPDDWVLVMAGWGWMQQKLMMEIAPRYARKSRFTRATNILFPKPDYRNVGSLYNASNVLCIPSHKEAFPLVMIEGWLTSTPVVITNQPIIDELNQKLELTQPIVQTVPIDPTPQQLAEAILIADQWGEAERKYPRELATRYFTAGKMVARWEAYLFQCLQIWHQSSFSNEIQYVPSPHE
jgi:glycosyltransferase involved in cell wall biosynthesis